MQEQQVRVPYRPLNGIVLLDKPTGISSNQALQNVRRLYRAKKAGHTGALDPLASGMLPICFGESTRLAGLLLNADKAYTTTAILGARSSTGDCEGELSDERPVAPMTADQIESVLTRFRGQISQVPPMYSALKHQGQPLYKLARQGKAVERKAREVQIHELQLLERDQRSMRLRVRCSKGTYIRTLVEDIGGALGCGAYVGALHRDWVEGFADLPMHDLGALQSMSEGELQQCLLPTEAGLRNLPQIHLNAKQAERLRHGQAMFLDQTPLPSAAVFDPKRQLLAVAAIDAQGRLNVTARFGTKNPASDESA